MQIKRAGWRTGAKFIVPAIVIALSLCCAGSPEALAQDEELQYGLTPVYGKPMAPRLDLEGLDGMRYELSEYLGGVVLVNFWATWCPPCVREMPTLQQLRHKLRDREFEILAVNLGEDVETIEAFLAKMSPSLEFPILLATDESIMTEWKILGLPATYIVDTKGRWVYQAIGPRNFAHQHIVSRIEELIGQ